MKEALSIVMILTIVLTLLVLPTHGEASESLDAIYVVDITGSMIPYMDVVREQLIELTSQLRTQYSPFLAGVVGFKDYLVDTTWLPLTDDYSQVESFIQSLLVYTGEDIPQSHYIGLEKASELLDGSSAQRRIVVFVSDAEAGYNDMPEWTRAPDAALALANESVRIHSVLCDMDSIPDEPEYSQLKYYSDISCGNFIFGAENIVEGVIYTPPPPCPRAKLILNKFIDVNDNGIYDAGDEGTSGWLIDVTDPYGVTTTYQTPIVVKITDLGVYIVTEKLPAEQSAVRVDGAYITPPTATVNILIDEGETHDVLYGNRYPLYPPPVDIVLNVDPISVAVPELVTFEWYIESPPEIVPDYVELFLEDPNSAVILLEIYRNFPNDFTGSYVWTSAPPGGTWEVDIYYYYYYLGQQCIVGAMHTFSVAPVTFPAPVITLLVDPLEVTVPEPATFEWLIESPPEIVPERIELILQDPYATVITLGTYEDFPNDLIGSYVWTSTPPNGTWYGCIDYYYTHLGVPYMQRVCAKLQCTSLPEPDFEISILPRSRTIQVGDTVTYEVSLIPIRGFDSEVSLHLVESDLPGDTSYSFDPKIIKPGMISILEITTSISTPLTTSTVTVVGTSVDITNMATFSLKTELFLEIFIEKFYTKTDTTRPFFQITTEYEFFRAPQEGHEIAISKAEKSYPGPLWIPYNSQPTFPLEIEIKAFSTTTEQEIGTAVLIIDSPRTLPTQAEFNLANIYMKVHIRSLTSVKIPEPYFPDGITPEYTPYLTEEWYWYAVEADKVWNNFQDSDFDEIVVAVLDTGVNWWHPALSHVIWINEGEIGLDAFERDKRTNMWDDDANGYIDDWHGYDFVGLVHDNDPMDESVASHGTGVAGIIAAIAQTGYTAGVAATMRGRIKIMPVRVMDGSLDPSTPAIDLAQGIRYAITNKANVISMSLHVSTNPLVQEAIEDALKEGILLISAAGNYRSMVETYPASYTSVMSVTGVKNESSYAGFWTYSGSGDGSNYGPSLKFNKGDSTEVSAPSEGITTITRDLEINPLASGTSMAVPIVTAIAAMVIGYASHEYGRYLSPNEVRHIIRTSSIDLGSQKWDPYYGYGLVNAYEALNKVDELLGRKHWQIKLDPPANLDLHLYDSLGRHIGLNYTTDKLENEIPAAVHTGDEVGGFETIFLPLDITDFEIEIVATEVNGSSPYILRIAASNETGSILDEWNFSGDITQDEIHHFTSTTTETGEAVVVSWEHIFKDTRRGTLLKISPDDQYFQFIAPDKTFTVKYDPNMRLHEYGDSNSITICYEDDEMRLSAYALHGRFDFCFAYAKDLQTGKTYWLIDKPNWRFCKTTNKGRFDIMR